MRELVLLFLKLGTIAFGGPAGASCQFVAESLGDRVVPLDKWTIVHSV